MAGVVSFEDFKFRKRIIQLFDIGLEECTDDGKEFFVGLIVNMIIPRLKMELKEKQLELNIDNLRQDVRFYEILFDVVSDCLIDVDPALQVSSLDFRKEVKEYLLDSRETDKDRMLFDYELDYRPKISEYEFDLKRIVNDISFYIRRKIDDSVTRKK